MGSGGALASSDTAEVGGACGTLVHPMAAAASNVRTVCIALLSSIESPTCTGDAKSLAISTMRRALCLVFLAACSRTASGDAGPAARGYGDVMSDVGRRFELAGRAAAANRFELAAFEIGEMRELFEGDLSRATLPKEGPKEALASTAKGFVEVNLPELEKAASAKDARAFAAAFQRASVTCNGCHTSSGHGFIQIPSVPGKSVPDLEAP